MKQVTIESIRQRIADLESAGKVVGGLSLSSEFELACLRELVALTEHRDALVVDNWNLRDVLRQLIAARPGGVYFNKWEPVILKALNELHATDAAIASLRAEGVEMFAESQKAYVRDNRNSLDAMTCAAYCGSAVDAERFSRQLRESKGAQS